MVLILCLFVLGGRTCIYSKKSVCSDKVLFYFIFLSNVQTLLQYAIYSEVSSSSETFLILNNKLRFRFCKFSLKWPFWFHRACTLQTKKWVKVKVLSSLQKNWMFCVCIWLRLLNLSFSSFVICQDEHVLSLQWSQADMDWHEFLIYELQ